jgi:ferredoxin
MIRAMVDTAPAIAQHAPRILKIEPLGVIVPMAEGQSLLDAAAAAGVVLPRSCRNGTCRACIAHLLHGRVRHRIEWPGLSADEKTAGWVLPCVAVAETDVVLLQPRALDGSPDQLPP